MKKRGIIVGDMHCGHMAGLTPPSWQRILLDDDEKKNQKAYELSRLLWDQYTALLKKHAPYDFGISMGDSVDGQGKRSGGSELLTSDTDIQEEIAIKCHNQVGRHGKKGFEWVGVYGTGYHTGNETDWEDAVARECGFKKIGSHVWIEVNGHVFDIKHSIGGSTIPHGRHTAIAKDRLWNIMWAEREQQPKAQTFFRGHCHFSSFCGGPGWAALTCPALQAAGTKYGARRCSGLVDWGITVVEVDDHGEMSFYQDTVVIDQQKAKVIRL